MPVNRESLNKKLYRALGRYDPKPVNDQNEVVPLEDEADAFKFNFTKNGENYGLVYVTLDDTNTLTVWYDNEIMDSPSNVTPGLDYNDTWTGFLQFLKRWSMNNQLSFKLENKDRLGNEMTRRKTMKEKEKIAEGYHAMGKKASYNDAIPSVKIVLQHSKIMQEGEQRFRHIEKIFVENQQGERFLVPTNRPGLARVFARHIAEGGTPYDERAGHIQSLVEEYNKMAGFVRATRSGQFNESAQQLVQEGVNHYLSLRESLSKLTGHRGYTAYFESWTPPLMEDETDAGSINELFVQETLDPRIESVMPILNRLHKKVNEMSEVKSLEEWADTVISEKMVMGADTDASSAGTMYGEASDKLSIPEEGEEDDLDENFLDKAKEVGKKVGGKILDKLGHGSDEELLRDLQKRAGVRGMNHGKSSMAHSDVEKRDVEENFISMDPQAVAEEEGVEEVSSNTLKSYQQKVSNDSMKHKMDPTKRSPEKANRSVGGFAKAQNRLEKGVAEGIKEIDMTGKKCAACKKGTYQETGMHDDMDGVLHCTGCGKQVTRWQAYKEKGVAEDLDANQKRVGQLGPTEKVKNNNIGKLVGANESVEVKEGQEDLDAILRIIRK